MVSSGCLNTIEEKDRGSRVDTFTAYYFMCLLGGDKPSYTSCAVTLISDQAEHNAAIICRFFVDLVLCQMLLLLSSLFVHRYSQQLKYHYITLK